MEWWVAEPDRETGTTVRRIALCMLALVLWVPQAAAQFTVDVPNDPPPPVTEGTSLREAVGFSVATPGLSTMKSPPSALANSHAMDWIVLPFDLALLKSKKCDSDRWRSSSASPVVTVRRFMRFLTEGLAG